MERHATVAELFARGSVRSGAAIVLGLAVQYGFTVLASRNLGSAAAGEFFVVLSVIWFAAIVARGGRDKVALKFIAVHDQHGDRVSVALIFRRLTRDVLVRGIIVALVLNVCRPILGHVYGWSMTGGEFLAFSVLVPVVTVSYTIADALRGKREVGIAETVRSILLYSPAIVMLLAVPGARVGGREVIFSLLVGGALSVVVGLWRASRTLRSPEGPRQPREEPHLDWQAMLEGAPSFMGLAMLAFFSSSVAGVDVLMIGAVTDPHTVALYVAASRTVLAAAVGLRALNNILEPLVASAYAARDRVGLQKVIGMSARWSFGSSVFVGGMLVLLARPILRLFGAGYEAAWLAMIVLVVGQLVNAGTGPVSMVMQMIGYERAAARLFGAVLVLMVPAYGIAAAAAGVAGAAMITAVGRAVQWVSMVIVVQRRERLRTYVDERTMVMTAVACVVVVFLGQMFSPSVSAVIFGVAMSIGIWYVILDEQDRRLVRHWLAFARSTEENGR